MDEADALYALPPGEFAAGRDALARRLRGEGRRAEADAVKALRSPTLPAWTANQLARRRSAEVDGLARAGAAYRRTQRPEELGKERAALSALLGAARELLREAGRQPSQSVLDRVRATLQAAAADDEAAEALRAGQLARELEAPALEAFLAAGAAARPRAPRARKPEPDRRAAREELRQARAVEREARRAVDHAEKELERARRGLDEARERVSEAERRLG